MKRYESAKSKRFLYYTRLIKWKIKDLKVYWVSHNAIPVVVVLLTGAIVLGVLSAKVDIVIEQQQKIKTEFRNWKTQEETRLGQAELDIAVAEQKVE